MIFQHTALSIHSIDSNNRKVNSVMPNDIISVSDFITSLEIDSQELL